MCSSDLRYVASDDAYAVENPIQLQQKVIDRNKMKTARNKLQGFRDYAKVMLKMADGWLSLDLVDQHSIGQPDYYGRKGFELDGKKYDHWSLSSSISNSTAKELYTAMCNATDETYPQLLCMICAGSNAKESRIAKTIQVERSDYNGNKRMETQHIREYQYDHKTVDNRINYIIKACEDVFTTREVAMGVVATNTL